MTLGTNIPGERIIWIDADDTTRERAGCDSTREGVIADIVSGEIDGGVLWSVQDDVPTRDITEDMAREALGVFAEQATELEDWHRVPHLIRQQCGDEVESERAAWLAESVDEMNNMEDLRKSGLASLGLTRGVGV